MPINFEGKLKIWMRSGKAIRNKEMSRGYSPGLYPGGERTLL